MNEESKDLLQTIIWIVVALILVAFGVYFFLKLLVRVDPPPKPEPVESVIITPEQVFNPDMGK